ncbi:hypothetical protein ABL78_5950 [Leptomonas seymouri]|uniref:Glucosidase II beta subunit-like protein n=1 Tax=Leptomonas seymouri TaxID=5684 RepID=A0A0N1IJC1_LEPSE|nr:hypothetical protein ABL78_5950 [Leptomonas seymouri]|eukprot:KPI84984.1 hypothetical protein ABL78_5950 [Leptomonas seymouri]
MPSKAAGGERAAGEEKTTARPHEPTAPTPRSHHEKKFGEPKCGAAGAPPATAIASQHHAQALRPKRVGISLKLILLSIALVLMSCVVPTSLFIGLQALVVDEMNLSRTAARMKLAGWGEEWLPVWLGRYVVDSLTAIHDNARGDEASALPSRTMARPIQPPPRTSVFKPTDEKKVPNSADAAPAPLSTTDRVQLRCYTLEAYSETFLQPPRKGKAEHLFSCGTRVSDLRSEDRADVLEACEAGTIYPKDSTGDQATVSHFATLRVVLTPSEEKRHFSVQLANAVTQRIPLVRVNDDYCDCLDGTDELLTNACSMSGPLTPAAGSRWKSYLVSNQAIRLYDDPDLLEQEDQESRGFPHVPRKRGDVGDRLYVSQGPVLPFVCTCGTVRQLLAPSLVGDGVVDCCGAEDEAVLQSSPFVSSSLSSNRSPHVQAALHRALAAERADMMAKWKRRQAEAATQLDATVRYADALFPYHTSAQALLVDKGYYSLFHPDVVQQERKAAATMLYDLYAQGHLTQRKRVQRGWERLGQRLIENRTTLQMELVNVSRELEHLERFVQNRMEERRTNNPIEAGVPMELLQQHSQLAHAHQQLQLDIQHIVTTTVHHAYGDHYEYYPLVHRILAMTSDEVTDSNTPPDLHSAIAQERARRLVSFLKLEELAMTAHERGEMTPPFHIDNISVSHYGINIMRHAIVAQRFDPSEAPYIAVRHGLIPPESTAQFDPHIFDNITDPFLRSPIMPLGSWQPYHTERNGRSLQLADPAGDLHLARRACVAPASPLYRGGGRLQLPTRHPEAPRTVTIPDDNDKKKSLKDKLKAVAEGQQSAAKKVSIPYHFHMPSIFAVDRYVGFARCGPDPLPASVRRRRSRADQSEGPQKSEQTLLVYTTYLCDTEDRLLYWGRNGKCTQEVIVGTPSACTAWALKAAKEALKGLTPGPQPK